MIRKKDLESRLSKIEERQYYYKKTQERLEDQMEKLTDILFYLIDELGYEVVDVEKHTKLEKKDERD